MESPMPNCSMHHREPKGEIDNTGQFLQGASCTIAAQDTMNTAGIRIQVVGPPNGGRPQTVGVI
jgi:hypothetical protein